ncbi:probable nuclear hormone receptor HR38 isoform X2 [Hyalella azteca]|uniref:Probable nuclear hormone receptor HR38 isoform X2 n=1 Tax=Hyalella azteca TaxID=294128 RepID=A0A8B7N4R6_HYAAZ|nr:probable nuclear hormone receptor HR38 isoform X2 [Hyalella azteca]
MCRHIIMGTLKFDGAIASREGKIRNKVAQSCIQTIDHLIRTMKSVVYAADCVNACRGPGMASRSLQSLPSTTTITTTIATTTITTCATTRGSACVATSSHHHHHHHHHRNQHHPQVQSQPQQPQPHRQHQYHHQAVRQQDRYVENYNQLHQPHHIQPSDRKFYSCQEVERLQELQQSNPIPDFNQQYPTRIARRDGEELHSISASSRRYPQDSEVQRPYIKPAANKTLDDLKPSQAHHISSSIPFQVRVASPDAASVMCYSPTSSSSPLLCPAHPNHLQHSGMAPSAPVMPSASPPSGASVRPRSCKNRGASSSDPRSSDTRNPNSSPQPTIKSKNPLNFLKSSPKNRKENSMRKISPQNIKNSNCSSGNCSSSSSTSIANNCCNSNLIKSFGSKIDSREKGSLYVVGVPDNSHCYSASLPLLPSAVQNKNSSILMSHSVTNSEGLTPPLPCPLGPSSVADVTLLSCHPSSLGQSTEISAPSIMSPQQETINYQQQHYQRPQYHQAEYQQDSSASQTPVSPYEYDQLTDDNRLHYPLTSSVPSSSLSRSPSSLQFQAFDDVSCGLPTGQEDMSRRSTNHADLDERIGTQVDLGERLHSPSELDCQLLHSPSDLENRIQSPETFSDRSNSPLCLTGGSLGPCAVPKCSAKSRSTRSASTVDSLFENRISRSLQSDRQRTEISGVSCGTIVRISSPRENRTSRPASLASDELFGVPSEAPPSYREVLLHPDHFRIPLPNESISSFSASDGECLSSPPASAPLVENETHGELVRLGRGGEEELRAKLLPVHDGDFPREEQRRIAQPTSSNSSIAPLYASCFEKEVI